MAGGRGINNHNNSTHIHHQRRRSKESSSVESQFLALVRSIRGVRLPFASNSTWSTVVLLLVPVVLLVVGSLRFRNHPTKSQPYSDDYNIGTEYDANSHVDNKMLMEYRMIEEVVGGTSRSYRKYVAVWSDESGRDDPPPPPHHHRAPMNVTILNNTNTSYVTVSQWVQAVLDTHRDDTSTTIYDTAATATNTNNRGNLAIQLLNEIIRTSPYEALFFETPAISSYSQYQTQPFEFVLVNAPELNEKTVLYNNNHHDIHSFEKPLSSVSVKTDNPYAASFFNLGGDAMLIVPKNIPSVDSVDVKSHTDNVAGGTIVVPSYGTIRPFG